MPGVEKCCPSKLVAELLTVHTHTHTHIHPELSETFLQLINIMTSLAHTSGRYPMITTNGNKGGEKKERESLIFLTWEVGGGELSVFLRPFLYRSGTLKTRDCIWYA